MFLHELQDYIDAAADDMEVCFIVRATATAKIIAVTYDVIAGIGEYGELMIKIRA